MIRLLPALALAAAPACADIVTPLAVIPAGTVVEGHHLTIAPGDMPGALSDPRDAIGLETVVTLWPNRPVRAQDLGMPTVVDRNERVRLTYAVGGLSITVDGRSLGRAGAGEPVRVMNMASRNTVTGIATGPGHVEVR